jgi:hypothetical protein
MPAIFRVGTIEEAQQAWREITSTGNHPYPLGSGTGTADPLPSFTVQLICGLAQIQEINQADRQITAGCGMTITALESKLTTLGLRFPAVVFNPAKVTLGGWLGAGMPGSGGRILPARRLLAATLLTPQGRLIHSGAATPKDVAGYDFHRPLVGAWGRLGMLLRVTLAVDTQPAKIQILHLIPVDPVHLLKQLERFKTVKRVWAETSANALNLWLEQNGDAKAMADDWEQLRTSASVCEVLGKDTHGVWHEVLSSAFTREGYYQRRALPAAHACAELARGDWWGNPWEGQIWRYLGKDKPTSNLPAEQLVYAREADKLYPLSITSPEISDFYITNV